jgi:hypothetical protein
MRNLKYTKKIVEATPAMRTDYNPDVPGNWSEICDVLEKLRREKCSDIDWLSAERALEAAGVANKTQALLVLKAKGMIISRVPRKGVDY